MSSRTLQFCFRSLLIGSLIATFHLLPAAGSAVGVAYGRNGNNLPSPGQVVSLLKSNNIGQVRIYDTDGGVLGAFKGSGISLIVGVLNDQLQSLASGQDKANQWVQNNIVPYASEIKYIAVGNEVLTRNTQYTQFLFPAMKNIYTALGSSNLQGSIKVSTSHASDVLGSGSFPPSKGNFGSQIRNQMSSILQFLSQTGAPFMANVYPFFTYLNGIGQIQLSYALFEPAAGVDDAGTGLHYTNLFDAEMDTLIAAMEALGHGDIPIVVTESGWASSGDAAATVDNAKAYNNNLVRHVSRGTPKRPNVLIQTYIFSLFNEDLKPGPEYERHFGLFNPDQSKVYDIALSNILHANW